MPKPSGTRTSTRPTLAPPWLRPTPTGPGRRSGASPAAQQRPALRAVDPRGNHRHPGLVLGAADTPSSGGCAYGAVDLHTGAYIRLTNTTLTRDEFLVYYPTAQQFDGLLIADSDGNGHLDDF